MEPLGATVFLFRFGTEADKRKMIAGGPWHHEQALVLLIETISIGDVSQQTFTYVSFWGQLKNVPIMCVEKEIITEMGEAIGRVKEVETNEN